MGERWGTWPPAPASAAPETRRARRGSPATRPAMPRATPLRPSTGAAPSRASSSLGPRSRPHGATEAATTAMRTGSFRAESRSLANILGPKTKGTGMLFMYFLVLLLSPVGVVIMFVCVGQFPAMIHREHCTTQTKSNVNQRQESRDTVQSDKSDATKFCFLS